jgi:hypothetical protein
VRTFVLVRNQRVGANQNSFDPAKDGGICPDAERKTKDRENGEAGAAPEHAGTEAQILPKLLWPYPDTLRARDFLNLLDSTKFTKCCVARIFRRHACGDFAFG